MNVNYGVLLAFDVIYDNPRLDLPFGRISKHQDWDGEEGDIICFDATGQVASAHMVEHVSSGLPELFGEQLKSAFILVREEGLYCTRLAALPLSAQQIAKTIETTSGLADINSITKTFLPKFEGNRVWARTDGQLFGRILLLGTIEEVSENHGVSAEAVADLLRLLRQTQTAATPFTFFDLLICPSPWPGNADQFTALVTRTGAIIETDRKLRLPLSAFDLVEYVSFTAIIRHMGERIKQLPLGESSLSEYLAQPRFKPGEALSSYSAIHLRDRERTLQQLLETQRTLGELRSRLQSNYVEIARRNSFSRSFSTTLSHPLKFLLFDRLVGNLDKAVANYEVARQTVESREQAARDYLRDRLMAETTASNLGIQKRIRFLTAAAVIIGLLALASNFLPDTVKEIVYNRIRAWVECVF
jgi:hypothetical protein